MASHDNSNNRLYVIPTVHPHSPVIRRTLSVGEPTYVVMQPQRYRVVTPLPTHQVLVPSPQPRFASYLTSRRPRSRSDGGPTVLLMPTVVPTAPTIPRYCRRRTPVKSPNETGNTVAEASIQSGNPTPPLARTELNGKVLCSNCGVQSISSSKCDSCRKEINKQTLEPSAARDESDGNSQNSIPSSSFYNGRQETDFRRYVRAANLGSTSKKSLRKRPVVANTKQSENVCITISSDSEDEEGTKPSTSDSPSPVLENVVENEEIPRKRPRREDISPTKPEETLRSTSPVLSHAVKSDEELAKMTLNLKVDSIRLGQMKLQPKSILRISHENLTMTASGTHLKCDTILNIKWQDIGNCEFCADEKESCLYLEVKQGALPQLRELLGMQKGKFPYYDPTGEDDERFFILYVNTAFIISSTLSTAQNLERKIEIVRKKLKKPSTFFQRIPFSESERRQSLAAAKMETTTETNNRDDDVSQDSALATAAPPGGNETQTSETIQKEIVTRNKSKQMSDDLKFMFSGPRVELFVYPPPPVKGGISVTNEDQFCLNEGEFLNDVIIEFYLKYVYNKVLSEEDRQRSHMFSCFFYERLMQKTNKKVKDVSLAERRHGNVKKWTRNIDIFSKDFIFVPINEASHWYLAVICFPAIEGEVMEILKQDGSKVTTQVLKSSLPKSMQYLSEYGAMTEDEDSQMSEVKGQGHDKRDLLPKKSANKPDVETADSKDKESVCKGDLETAHEDKGQVDRKLGLEREDAKFEIENKKKKKNEDSEAKSIVLKGSSQGHLLQTLTPGPEKGKLISVDLPGVTIRRKLQHRKVLHRPDASPNMAAELEIKSKFGSNECDFKKNNADGGDSVEPQDPNNDRDSDRTLPTSEETPSPEATPALISKRPDDPPTPKELDDILALKGSVQTEQVATEKPTVCGELNIKPDEASPDKSATNFAHLTSGLDATSEICPFKHEAETLSPKNTQKNGKIVNIYVLPGTQPFCLPKELEQKCKITPEKKPRIQIQKLPNQSPVKVTNMEIVAKTGNCRDTPVKISSSSLSSDESVIVLSSPDSFIVEKQGIMQNMPSKKLLNGNAIDKSLSSLRGDGCDDLIRQGHAPRSSEILKLPSNVLVDKSINERSLHLHFETSNHDLSDDLFKSDPHSLEQSPGLILTQPLTSQTQITDCVLMEDDDGPSSGNGLASDTTDYPTPLDGSIKTNTTTVTTVDGPGNIILSNDPKSAIVRDVKTQCIVEAVETKCEIEGAPPSGETNSSTQISNRADIHFSSYKPSISVSSATDESSSEKSDTRPTNINARTEIIAREQKEKPSTSKENEEKSAQVLETSGDGTLDAEDAKQPTDHEVSEIQTFKRPCILIFDSLRGPSRSKIATSLREYLNMEWKTRKKEKHGEKIFDKDTLKMCSVLVPQQDNFTDCGLFLLHYVEKFFRSPIRNFSLPIRDLENWFDPRECREKRQSIKKVIDELHEDWIARNSRK